MNESEKDLSLLNYVFVGRQLKKQNTQPLCGRYHRHAVQQDHKRLDD